MATTEPKKIDTTPDMEYVEIPEKDLFDNKFDGIWNNRDHYGPGVHFVAKPVATHLRERLKVWHDEQIRQLRPNADPRVAAALKANRDRQS